MAATPLSVKRINYHSNSILQLLIALVSLVAAIAVITQEFQHSWVNPFLIGFSIVTVFLVLLEFYSYTTFFLLSTFTFIASWRLAALANDTWAEYSYLVAFILIFIQFIITAKRSLNEKNIQASANVVSIYEWQLVFVRLYIGCDLILHFCEKLFAGPIVRQGDINAFIQLGVPHATSFVFIAGVIEFAGAFSLSCGLFTRLGSVCLFTYLMVATFLGHHFSNGFIWAEPGGGWEYPVLWSVLVLSFAIAGATTFSLDEVLQERYKLPKAIKLLMGFGSIGYRS